MYSFLFRSYFLDNTVKIPLVSRLIVYHLPYNILHYNIIIFHTENVYTEFNIIFVSIPTRI